LLRERSRALPAEFGIRGIFSLTRWAFDDHSRSLLSDVTKDYQRYGSGVR
jgi:hypothetical protein